MKPELRSGWTIITVTYNSAATLKKYWADGAPLNSEWIVVDNDSTDGTPQVAAELGATVVKLERNLGFSSANNVGFNAAETEFVCFANPDITIPDNGLDLLAKVIDENGGIVAPQLLNPDGTTQPNGRGFPILADKIKNRLRVGDSAFRYHRIAAPGDTIPAVWVMGAALGARRSTFAAINAWDDHFFLYYEDKDICLRAWERGIPVYITGVTNWTHGWARETSKFRLQPWKRELSSMYKFYRRYPQFMTSEKIAARRYPAIASAMTQLGK